MAVKRQLRTSERLRVSISGGRLCEKNPACTSADDLAVDAPDPTEWRVIDHCSAVTRLYALYEQFAHEMLRERLSHLERRSRFTDLPVAFQVAYRTGVARILEKKDGPRYQTISLTDLLSNFHHALAGELEYKLEPLALLVHEQNLRLGELCRLYSDCVIPNLSDWISNHPEVEGFFREQDRLHASAESELKAIVEYRNDAAHGALTLDDVLSVDSLCEFADFLSALCVALAERVQRTVLVEGLPAGRSQDCGTITETYQGREIIVARVRGKFRIGQPLYITNDRRCSERRIKNIQLNGENREQVEAAEEVELGFQLDGKAKVGLRLMTLAEPTEAAPEETLAESVEGAPEDEGASIAQAVQQ